MSKRTRSLPAGVREVTTGSGRTRYRVVVDAGHHPDGRRRQATRTVDTLREAKAFIAATRADVERGTFVASDGTTVAEACESFLASKAVKVRAVTLGTYRSSLRHVIDAYGDKRLQSLTRQDVERLRDEMLAEGKSGRTVGLVLLLLRGVLAEALADGRLVRNVAARVAGPSQDPKRRESLTGDEVAKISAAAEGHRLYGCWLLTLFGLRRSEVMGLRWSDIAEDGTLTVERGRVLVDGHRTEVGRTKTLNGVRTLTLPPHIRKALATMRTRRDEEMLALGRKVSEEDYIATDETGRPLRPERYSDEWRELCKAAGVRPVVLHAARHSSVSLLRAAGVPGHVIAAWHGHDEVVMRRTYSHVFAEDMAAAGEVLGDVIGGGRSAGPL